MGFMLTRFTHAENAQQYLPSGPYPSIPTSLIPKQGNPPMEEILRILMTDPAFNISFEKTTQTPADHITVTLYHKANGRGKSFDFPISTDNPTEFGIMVRRWMGPTALSMSEDDDDTYHR